MKKVLKISRNIILGLILVIALIIGGSFLNHQIRSKSEAKKIKDYGEKIEVFDGTMNVVRDGSGEGKQTIILFPGYGTATPYYDFLPLTTKLSDTFEVITVEPFGYGLSSETKRERTIENIVEEMHEVITKLNVDDYILGGHSVAGLYGVNYLNRYPDEKVTAFVGVDTSYPTQEMVSVNMAPFNFLKKAGFMRLFIDMNPAKNLALSEDDPNLEQVRMLTLKNGINDNLDEELNLLLDNFKKTEKMTLPEDLPTLMFVATPNSRENWLEDHQEQIKQVKNGEVIPLEGSHYLHHTQSETIAKETKQFIEALK